MDFIKKVLICLIFTALLFSGWASAGFTMSMGIRAPDFRSLKNSTLTVELTNSGDETAFDASISILSPKGLDSDIIHFPDLRPNVKNAKTVPVSLGGELSPGTYPLLLSLQFHDKNKYPIYMVFDSRVVVGKMTNSKVYAEMEEISFPLDGSGKMILRLKNADSSSHDVKVSIYTPESLKAEPEYLEATLPAKSEQELEFTVSNFMALPDSNLAVLAVIEYGSDLHYSSLAAGRVRLSAQSEGREFFLPAAAAVVLLALGFIYFKYLR
jgi:hypothetical protein